MTPDRFETNRRHFLRLASGVAIVVLGPRPGGAQAPLKVGMIGSGREGSALGSLFVKAGHPVMFSSRNPERLKDLAAGLGPLAQAGTVEQAVAFADVIALVVPYPAIEGIAKAQGAEIAKKALVLDVSNPIPRRDGEEYVKKISDAGGAGLMTARLLAGARVVRGFNAIGSTQLAGLSHRAGDPVGVPIAGDDASAITLAEKLIREIGFEPVLVGGLAMGKYLVPGTPLAGVHSPAELKQIAGTLR